MDQKRKMMLFALAILSGLWAMPLGVAAQSVDSITSDADIEFYANTGPTKPVYPENPGEPDPDPGKPSRPGSLAIVWVSPFRYGRIPVSVQSENYYVTTEQPNLQVVDLRGIHSGWSVSAQLSAFIEVDEDGDPVEQEGDPTSLRGAVLHITNGRLNSLTGAQYEPDVYENVELLPGLSAKTILSAQPEHGMGLWVNRWYPENTAENSYVYLDVPAGSAQVGTHVATITWQLLDTP